MLQTDLQSQIFRVKYSPFTHFTKTRTGLIEFTYFWKVYQFSLLFLLAHIFQPGVRIWSISMS